MTGPAHVPDTLLLAGGAGFFDAACVAALAKCGYDPEDFGTYDDVYKRIREKRAVCDLHDDFHRDPQGPPPGISDSQRERRERALEEHLGPHPRQQPAAAPPVPTAEDRRTADSQSGHLSQNAAHQGVRGDPCSNPPSCRQTYVPPARRGTSGARPLAAGGFRTNTMQQGCNGTPGYMSDDAPCMPHQGRSGTPGTGHNFVTCQECDAANNNGDANAPYSRDQESRDADARTEALLTEHGNGMPPPTSETAAGSAADQPNPDGAGDTGAASGADAGTPADAAAGSKDSDAAKKAADCINQYRKAAMAEMADRCASNEDAYKDAAGTSAERQALLDRRDAARNTLDALDPETADPDVLRGARGDYNRAAAAHNRAQHASCLAQQSRALQRSGGQPSGDCRTPSTHFAPDNWSGGQANNSSDAL
ncbi:MAG: hypothetical protein AB8I08_27545 [Sandaracinaceae bacterium]